VLLPRLYCCLVVRTQARGPAPPVYQCLDSSWSPNAFTIVMGEEKLGAFLNFENADSTRFSCTDCWSVMFADHTFYDKKVLVTQIMNYQEFEGLTNVELMPPEARHFVKDLSPDQLAALPRWREDPQPDTSTANPTATKYTQS